MSIPVDATIKQVYARLAETIGSPIAELPDTTGGAGDITSDEQILNYLNEGQELLAQTPLLTIWGTASATISSGAIQTTFTDLTPAVSGQRMWSAVAARWGSTPIDVCDAKWFRVHNPNPAQTGTPARVYNDSDGVLIAPRPTASATLTLEGWMLPRAGTSGSNFADLRAELAPFLIAYGCWKACIALVEEPKFATALKLFEAEWKSAAGLSLGATMPGIK
jgi:hypothetical protein